MEIKANVNEGDVSIKSPQENKGQEKEQVIGEKKEPDLVTRVSQFKPEEKKSQDLRSRIVY